MNPPLNPESRNTTRKDIAFEDERAISIGGVATFFTRRGGSSPKPLDSLNFSLTQGDTEKNVHHNLKIVSDFLSIDPGKIVLCDQRHSDTIATLSSLPTSVPIADAIIAERPGIYPAIRTADCLPILMMDPVNHISAAVHAGWRGTVRRIAAKVVYTLERSYGVVPADLLVALGPTIGSCCYTVDDTVIIPLSRAIPGSEKFVKRINSTRTSGPRTLYHLDLMEINRSDLISCGVLESNVNCELLCTSCRADLFFSHRRDGGHTGRHVSVVGFHS